MAFIDSVSLLLAAVDFSLLVPYDSVDHLFPVTPPARPLTPGGLHDSLKKALIQPALNVEMDDLWPTTMASARRAIFIAARPNHGKSRLLIHRNPAARQASSRS